MERSPNPRIAGQIRDEQNWIGGNDYNPCGVDFVPPPPEYVDELLQDLVIRDRRRPPAPARAGRAGPRAVRDDPPLPRRERAQRARAHPYDPAPTRHRAQSQMPPPRGDHRCAAGAPAAPVAAAAIDRSRPQVYQAIDQLEAAGVMQPLSTARRNRVWEAVGLLDLLAGLEAGEPPAG